MDNQNKMKGLCKDIEKDIENQDRKSFDINCDKMVKLIEELNL